MATELVTLQPGSAMPRADRVQQCSDALTVVVGTPVIGSLTVVGQPVTNTLEQLLGEGIILRQETTQCCRCLCCQPNIHWLISPWTEEVATLGGATAATRKGRMKLDGAIGAVGEDPVILYDEEEAPHWGRCYSWCAPGSRPTIFKTHAGADATGPVMMTHSKGCTNGVNQVIGVDNNGTIIRVPCCCCLPYLETKDMQGNLLGRSEYVCDFCLFVPKYRVLDGAQQMVYSVRPDVCCLGICVQCECGGKGAKCCRVPFYIREPVTREKLDGGDAAFVDMWAGWKAECCTQKDLYALKWPRAAPLAHKCALLGLAHLIDITVMEQEGG